MPFLGLFLLTFFINLLVVAMPTHFVMNFDTISMAPMKTFISPFGKLDVGMCCDVQRGNNVYQGEIHFCDKNWITCSYIIV